MPKTDLKFNQRKALCFGFISTQTLKKFTYRGMSLVMDIDGTFYKTYERWLHKKRSFTKIRRLKLTRTRKYFR